MRNFQPLFSALSAVLIISLLTFLSCEQSEPQSRPEGPGDIYAAAGFKPTAAHSTTRALFASYNGPLYQLTRQSDGETLDIGVIQPDNTNGGGYADAAAQDDFCKTSDCYISTIYDQSGYGNDLKQAPPGTFRGLAKGGFNNLPLADLAPITINGHKAYGAFIMPGTGLRNNNAVGLAINDEAEGIYMVLDGSHYSSGCCFNYGNTSTNSRAVGTGTMSTVYYGTATAWGKGEGEGPWIMSDMEAGLFSGYETKENAANPSIDSWRFVTGMVNGGGGNQWEIWGGNAQEGELNNFYKGERPQSKENEDYYPMHRKGSIQLGNGGDNGNGSAGTFYEGIMTEGYPTDEVNKAVHANIVAANYALPMVAISRVKSLTPNATQDVTLSFTNTTTETLSDIELGIELPDGWPSIEPIELSGPIAVGSTSEVTFTLTGSDKISNGYIRVKADVNDHSYETARRIRTVLPVKINEASFSGGSNPTNQFLELYNASESEVDISNWVVTNTPGEWSQLEMATIPEGTTLGAGEFYLLGLSPSALVAPANNGDNIVHVRSTQGLNSGDQIEIGDSGVNIKSVGTAASEKTLVYVPVTTGPWLEFPVGTTNLPVANADGFAVGDKIGIDLGGNYEIATVTEVGKGSTQSSLAEAAQAGDTLIKVWQNANMTPGDTLTINSGARVEKAVVKEVLNVVDAPLLGRFDGDPGQVILESPLKQDHMLAVDVASPGTGITFTPATKFAHKSGDAVQALGSGITLAEPLSSSFDVGIPILSDKISDSGYQGEISPNQYYGLPMSIYAGTITLMGPDREVVIDALVYGSQQGNSSSRGSVATPHVAVLEGDQGQGGCIAVLPGSTQGSFFDAYDPMIRSIGRYPNGADTDSNCEDFKSQPLSNLATSAKAGATNIKVESIEGYTVGQKLVIGTGSNAETTEISEIGTSGGALITSTAAAGATTIEVDNINGLTEGQTIIIGSGSKQEEAIIDTITRPRRSFGRPAQGGASVTIKDGLKFSHSKGEMLGGSGITLKAPLSSSHEKGVQFANSLPTPGQPNNY